MQTAFTLAQLADPQTARSEAILRRCVHCGFCTATCPTFVLLGDELDSPRGRIYLIKNMLEADAPATGQVVKHIDRCLSCLSCMTTCPSSVNYMHLVDHARAHIERTYKRPWHDRAIRRLLAAILPYPNRFRWAVRLSVLGRPFAGLLARRQTARLGAMLRLAPASLPRKPAETGPGVARAVAPRLGRIIVPTGCVQSVLAPDINAAACRLLTRAGYEIVRPAGEGCCGALVHHMGWENDAKTAARRNIDAWWPELQGEGIDAIAITASGCGTTIKDYGHLLADDPDYADKAAEISARARDVSEVLADVDLGAPMRSTSARVAYHSACSMQHGQGIRTQPKALLSTAGFTVLDVAEGHLCCGSAGVYNILQPEIADRLKQRKADNIDATGADLVATGNIGCMTQIGPATERPIVHTVQLLDWAYGGPLPKALAAHTAVLRRRPAAETAPAA
ncbi:glycolate oxidase subunit GlcF [Amorphus orientalis]|uniref:Glycolate oxidase iron-sulfur subunit n=1 Tax=Amorphus orientalis TaxID=649198 RepID=A0AAE3VST6_9HYPH|nr:glycolate oxidase subunit GlcF [Amorphus orientalis]MDQ0317557.1 glycolate oxidase iron-sulfur subunit [Amorphus orientalis]